MIPWITHGVFEFSGKMQTVEIFSPRRGPDGELAGIEHEIVFYDPEAFVQPLRLVQVHIKTGELSEVDPFIYARCIQTIFPVDGRPKPRAPARRSNTRCRTCTAARGPRSGSSTSRQGMKRPEGESIFEFEKGNP